ncbi:hypothetical protein DMO24_16175 [Modestobacter versicolor]|uniref:Uncharacterized protein n=1 Tax=Modestobacter versicolor TaxID=429133 RepID=A0A323V6X0_9ACTN|nr:hypothetical protein DMO24_16175 [Modestobacter versicolor]
MVGCSGIVAGMSSSCWRGGRTGQWPVAVITISDRSERLSSEAATGVFPVPRKRRRSPDPAARTIVPAPR